jgi:hypothetical protein
MELARECSIIVGLGLLHLIAMDGIQLLKISKVIASARSRNS